MAIDGTAGTGWSCCPVPWPEGHRSAPGMHGHVSPGLVSMLHIQKLGKSAANWLQEDLAFLAKLPLQQDSVLAPEFLLLFPCSGGGCQHQRASPENSVCEKPEQQSSRELPGGAGSREQEGSCGAERWCHSSGPCR